MKSKNSIVTINGAVGEGGGQMLRSALTLSMLTGKPFKMTNIRSKRKNPGLMRQHLTAVLAAQEISCAKVTGATMGSTELIFIPQTINSGHYDFAIGTAGSTSLVAQTLIPALMMAKDPSVITLHGGTHNIQAPPFEFLQRTYCQTLKKIGIECDAELKHYGFYPAGGGEIIINIKPAKKLKPLNLMQRGKLKNKEAQACFAHMPANVAQRELTVVSKKLLWPEKHLLIKQVNNADCAGNVITLSLEHAELTEVFTGFGVRGVPAETVAETAVFAAKQYLSSDAAVSEHLADQLLIPMALGGGGQFTTTTPSQHTLTNIAVIQQFLECEFNVEEMSPQLWSIKCL